MIESDFGKDLPSVEDDMAEVLDYAMGILSLDEVMNADNGVKDKDELPQEENSNENNDHEDEYESIDEDMRVLKSLVPDYMADSRSHYLGIN